MYDVVVAKYKENIDWIRLLFDANSSVINRFYVYDKSECEWTPPKDLPVVFSKLPNIGREGGTFLHHITTHWDQLAECTLFLQGNPLDHMSTSDMAISLPVHEYVHGMPFYPRWICRETFFLDVSKSPYQLPVSTKLNQYFSRHSNSHEVTFATGAQYIVPRNILHARAKAFYDGLLEEMHRLKNEDENTFEELYRHNDPIHTLDAWTLERLWPDIFAIQGV